MSQNSPSSGSPRVVVVTGAAGGIGSKLVAGFLEKGDFVVAVDLGSSGILDTPASGALSTHACDVSDESQVVALFENIASRHECINALINNAALGPTMAPTVETTLDSFKQALSVNLLGPFTMAREAVKRMSHGGVVVNIASLAGMLGNPRRNAYAASKAGLISLTKSLACEWASQGVRVCGVAPGYVRTPMVAALESSGKIDLSAVRRRIPLGRLARPDEIASVAQFLASASARYITGVVFAVDGGWMSFNQPGDAHAGVEGTPTAELVRPTPTSGPRVVLVTGAATGIGEAIARRFAAAGDKIVAADRDGPGVASLVAQLGAQHLAVETDVASESSVTALLAKLRARFGGLDLLINNAAIADVFQPAFAQNTGDLQRVLDVNLTGAFLCAREALKALRPGGMILNIGSVNSFLPFAPRHAYGASKAGIEILSRCFAAELGPAGYRTATLAPGYIRTPGVRALETSGRIDIAAIRRRIPLGDLGEPQDIAEAAHFLASPAASYVNGSILYVDGGWTAFGAAGAASDPELEGGT